MLEFCWHDHSRFREIIEIWLATPFSLLKREWINRFKITDYKHDYRLIFEYIEAFYNTTTIYSHCEYISPNEYEKRYWKKTCTFS